MSFPNKRKTPFCPKCKAVRRIVVRRANLERGQAETFDFVCESAECKAARKRRRPPRCPDFGCRHSKLSHDADGCHARYSAGPSGTFRCPCKRQPETFPAPDPT